MSTSNHFLNALRADVVPLGNLSMGRSTLGVFVSDCSNIIGCQRGLRKSLATGNALRVSTGSVSVPGSGTFWHSASPVLLSTLNSLRMLTETVVVAAGGIQSVLRSRIKGVVLASSSEEVTPIATARRVTRVAGKQGEHIGSVMEQVGNPGGLQGSAMGLEQPVSIMVSATLPQPALVGTSHVNLRPKAGNVCIGEGWQGLRSGHVEPPFLASLRQFYQKGGF